MDVRFKRGDECGTNYNPLVANFAFPWYQSIKKDNDLENKEIEQRSSIQILFIFCVY